MNRAVLTFYALAAFASLAAPWRCASADALVTPRIPSPPAHAQPGLDGTCAFTAYPHCAGVGIDRIVESDSSYIEWLCLDNPGLQRCDMVLGLYAGGRFGAALERAFRAHLQEVCGRSGERPGCIGR